MKVAKPFSPNKRDCDLIKAVFEHRFLSTELLQALLTEPPREGRTYGFGSSAVKARCEKLREHGYLTRQFIADWPAGRGYTAPRPAVYSLGTRSADVLPDIYGIDRHEVRDILKGNARGSHFLRHALSIGRFRATLEKACRESGGRVELLWRQGRILKDTVEVQDGRGDPERLSVWPDAFFALKSGGKTAHFFLEVDQTTEELERIQEKARALWHYYHGENFARKYYYEPDALGGKRLLVRRTEKVDSRLAVKPSKRQNGAVEPISRFQVLFVVRPSLQDYELLASGESPLRGRQRNMVAAVRMLEELPEATKHFWFASELDFDLMRPASIFEDIWQSLPPDTTLHSLLEGSG